MSQHVQIKITPSSKGTEIIIDGVRQEGIRRLLVSAGVNEISTVTLERIGVDVQLEGDVDAVRDVSDLLTKLHDVQIAHLQPGDIVVLKTDGALSEQACNSITDYMSAVIKDTGAKVAVLGDGMDLTLVRPESVDIVEDRTSVSDEYRVCHAPDV